MINICFSNVCVKEDLTGLLIFLDTYLTFPTPQLHVAISCSQPSVTQEHLCFWILRSRPTFLRLSACVAADLHMAAVPVQIGESSPSLQMKPNQEQAAQRLIRLD